MYLLHQVIPSIVPFGFGEEQFNLDDSVSTVCSVVKGDLPLRIWWSFEDVNLASAYNITTNDGIIITRSSQKVSMLMIEAVKARHRGNYTCYAENRGGLSAQSAYLAINGLKISKISYMHQSSQLKQHYRDFAICVFEIFGQKKLIIFF